MATKKITAVTNIGTVIQAAFADLAAAVRVAESGLDWTPIGDIALAVRVVENTPVLIYNSTGSVAFVAFGAQTMSAPTTAANGIPVLAGQKCVLNSGPSAWIRASASGIFAYKGDGI